MKNILYSVNAEMEASLQAKRAALEQRMIKFNAFQAKKEILQFTKQQSNQQIEENQEVHHEKQRGILTALEPLLTTTQPLIVQPKTPPAEDSSDIDIVENTEVTRVTLQQELEYLKNRAIMEREDKNFEQKMLDKTAKIELHQTFLRENKYKICYSLYEELLQQITGPLDVKAVEAQYNAKKALIEADFPLFSENEICESYNQKLLDNYIEKGVIISSGGDCPFDFEGKINSELSGMVTQNQSSKLPISIQNKLQTQQVIEQEDAYFKPRISLFTHEESLQIEDTTIIDSVGEVNLFDFKNINIEQIAKFKENFISFNEQIKKAQVDLKAKNRTEPVKITINESLMIIPTIEAEKFLKSCTNESILISRINYLIYKSTNLDSYYVFEVLSQISQNTSKQQNSNIIVEKTELITPEDQINIYYPVKSSKLISEVENQFQFIIQNQIKFSQIYSSNTNSSAASNKPKSAGSSDNPLKAGLDANIKSKFAQITLSGFDEIFFLIKSPQTKLELKQNQQQKGKKVEADQTEAIIAQFQEKSVFQSKEFADVLIVEIQDESVNLLQQIYKTCSNSRLQTLTLAQFEQLTQINFSAVDLNNFCTLSSNFSEDIVKLSQMTNQLPGTLLNLEFLNPTNLKELLTPSTKAQIIKTLLTNYYIIIRKLQKQKLFKIQLLFRFLQLKSLLLRSNSITTITEIFNQGMEKISDEIDGNATFSQQKQTKIENFVHEMRENFTDALDEIFNTSTYFQSIFVEKSMLECCEIDLEMEIQILSEFIGKIFENESWVFLEESSVFFTDLVCQNVVQKIDELFTVSLLPLIFYNQLKEVFGLNCETVESFNTQIGQMVDFDRISKEKTAQITEFSDEKIQEIFVDLSSKFCLIQESEAVKNEISDIIIILQNEVKNSVDRSVKIGQRVYLLTLQNITKSCSVDNQTQYFLEKSKECLDLLQNENEFLGEVYQEIRNELNVKTDLSEVQNMFQGIEKPEKILVQVVEEEQLRIIQNLCFVDQVKFSEKLELNNEETIKAVQESVFVSKIITTSIPDPNPKAKKGATLSQSKNMYYYTPFINQIDQLELKLTSEQFTELASIYSSFFSLEPKRPQSAPKLDNKGKPIEEVVKINTNLVKFQNTVQFSQLSEFVQTLPEVFISKFHTREFMKLFTEKFSEILIIEEYVQLIPFVIFSFIPGVQIQEKIEILFKFGQEKVKKMTQFNKEIGFLLNLDFDGSMLVFETGETIEISGVERMFSLDNVDLNEKLDKIIAKEVEVVETRPISSKTSARSPSAKKK